MSAFDNFSKSYSYPTFFETASHQHGLEKLSPYFLAYMWRGRVVKWMNSEENDPVTLKEQMGAFLNKPLGNVITKVVGFMATWTLSIASCGLLYFAISRAYSRGTVAVKDNEGKIIQRELKLTDPYELLWNHLEELQRSNTDEAIKQELRRPEYFVNYEMIKGNQDFYHFNREIPIKLFDHYLKEHFKDKNEYALFNTVQEESLSTILTKESFEDESKNCFIIPIRDSQGIYSVFYFETKSGTLTRFYPVESEMNHCEKKVLEHLQSIGVKIQAQSKNENFCSLDSPWATGYHALIQLVENMHIDIPSEEILFQRYVNEVLQTRVQEMYQSVSDEGVLKVMQHFQPDLAKPPAMKLQEAIDRNEQEEELTTLIRAALWYGMEKKVIKEIAKQVQFDLPNENRENIDKVAKILQELMPTMESAVKMFAKAYDTALDHEQKLQDRLV